MTDINFNSISKDLSKFDLRHKLSAKRRTITNPPEQRYHTYTPEIQTSHQEPSKGRGGFRGRGGRQETQRGRWNSTPPSKSANLRLQRAPNDPQNLEKDKRNETATTNYLNDSFVEETFRRYDVGGSGCICLRPTKFVICRCCGYYAEGNLVLLQLFLDNYFSLIFRPSDSTVRTTSSRLVSLGFSVMSGEELQGSKGLPCRAKYARRI